MPQRPETLPADKTLLAPSDTGPRSIGLGGTDVQPEFPGSDGTGAVPVVPGPAAPSSNPLYASQWHFGLIGDIATVWEDYSGNGVAVGVYDDGVEAGHEDLAAGYDASRELDTVDAVPNSSSDGHGTSVAGIITGTDNSTGGVGIAYGASLTGVDYLNDAFTLSYAEYLAVLEETARFDVVNNSWGSLPSYSEHTDIGEPNQQAGLERAALDVAIATGRGGLGTILTKAAGNYANDSAGEDLGIYGNAHADGLNNLHEIITVAATGSTGYVTSYSNFGQALLIAAPAASVTTDRSGTAGYSSNDYTSNFGGTSAATPVITGVVALMLEANPDLHWTDVQNILAASAAQTGSAFGSAASGYERSAWISNAAETWNGGGMTFSASYGYGMVDAFAAVRMAEIWTTIHPDTAGKLTSRSASNLTDVSIADSDVTEVSVTLDDDQMIIDHLYVTIDYQHSWGSDLTLALVTPDGDEIILKQNEGYGSYNADWTFGISSLRGMTDGGTWTLRITDSVAQDSGTLRGVTFDFEGVEIGSGNQVLTFTDDFQDLADVETGRRVIELGNGSKHWINAVAVTGDSEVILGMTSAALSVDGTLWASTDRAVHAVATGDGNDTISVDLTGRTTVSDRHWLHGGRGDDVITGGTDSDYIEGGAGNDRIYDGGRLSEPASLDRANDTLYGGSGDDVIQAVWDAHGVLINGGDGNDTLEGGHTIVGGNGDDLISGARIANGDSGFDTIYGTAGADRLNGGTNADDLYGGSGDDLLLGELGTDHLHGDAGQDNIWGNASNDYLYGGDGDDRLFGGTEQDRAYGGAGSDTLAGEGGFDRLEGGSGDDFLYGGQQADNLFGDVGDDSLEGGQGLDRLFGGSGQDTLNGGIAGDGLFGGSGDDILYSGSGDDRIFGGSGNDLVNQGAGNDTIYANAGFDTILSSSGDDEIYGGFNADTFLFSGYFGDDTIRDFEADNDLEKIHFATSSPIRDFADLMANHASQQGSDVLIQDGYGNSITLAGINLASLDEADFAWV